MKKILVVNVNWLGDVLFSSPIFRALKEQYPDSEVCCLAVPRIASVLKYVPQVDRVIVYDEKGKDYFPWNKLKLILRLKKEGFDVAFLLHGSWTRAFLVFAAKIPVRVGYNTKKRGRFLTHIVKPQEGLQHRSDYYLNVIESYGVVARDRNYILRAEDEDKQKINKTLKEYSIDDNDSFIVLHVGGNWNLKRWPIENFAKLYEELREKVVVCGTSSEESLAREIEKLCAQKPINLAGKTTFGELVALLEKASLVVSADSGPLHAASAVGTPVVALFGPTHPQVTGPRGKGKHQVIRYEVGCNQKPCYYLQCSDNICMKAISVDDVIKKIDQIRHT